VEKAISGGGREREKLLRERNLEEEREEEETSYLCRAGRKKKIALTSAGRGGTFDGGRGKLGVPPLRLRSVLPAQGADATGCRKRRGGGGRKGLRSSIW